ncbi:hypothetical protein D3C87_2110380 [compost metagenome]
MIVPDTVPPVGEVIVTVGGVMSPVPPLTFPTSIPPISPITLSVSRLDTIGVLRNAIFVAMVCSDEAGGVT